MITIAIDAMGGDHGPSVIIPAAIQALVKHPNLQVILVGDERLLQEHLTQYLQFASRIQIQHASQQVGMDEPPAQALRNKKDSSMRVAINLVKSGVALGCVSAGNTGALMATARFVLKTLPQIDRPAIISTFPTKKPHRNVRMLDLGANVDSSANDLVQFAIMGSVLSQAMDGVSEPKIYLLNIGEEEIKGNELVKETAKLLNNIPDIHFAGYIEGDKLYEGNADIIVCDGFVGNVALKTSEGVALFITKLIKEAFMRNILTKFCGLLVKPVLKSFIKRIDPARYNGALFIGLNGIVIKSHGGANTLAFLHAIEEALECIEKNIPELIRYKVAELLNPIQPSTSE